MEPKYFEELLGKSASTDLIRGQPLKRENIHS
jgi:sialic acid synthase SpsE